MKPLRLTMSAFGSYANEQKIDFTKLGTNGLYIITGETGSGKTTIFDAISFALYGESSGGEREVKMLRSDFADDKTKTFVKLEFSSGNNRYHIKREIKKIGQDVTLELPDGTKIQGKNDVKAKIMEVIGLEKEQFAQIVMIAQNDFLRFLKSGTKERIMILRRIFGTSALNDLQVRLDERAKSESRKFDQIYSDFTRHDVDPNMRKEKFAEWEEQIKADNIELAAVEDKIKKCTGTKTSLAAETALAEKSNKNLDDLGVSKNSLKSLIDKADEVEAYRNMAARGEIALRKVKPFADDYTRTTASRDVATTALNTANAEFAAADTELIQATEAADAFPSLDDAKEAFNTLSSQYDKAVEDVDKLTALQNILRDIEAEKKKLSKMQEDFETLDEDFGKKDDEYKVLEETFLRNQAGILAKNLNKGMPCPVCGSKDHPSPAVLSDESISESKLNEAKKTLEKARSDRNDMSSECGKLEAKIKTSADNLMVDITTYMPDAEWDTLRTRLDDFAGEVRGHAAELKARKEADKKTLDGLTENLKKADERKKKAEINLGTAMGIRDTCRKAEDDAKQAAEEAHARYKNALKANGFANEQEYNAAVMTDDSLTALKKQISDHDTEVTRLGHEIKRLEEETAGKERVDVECLKEKSTATENELSEHNSNRDDIIIRLKTIGDALKELREASSKLEKTEKTYAIIKDLASTANGKLDFETYAQIAYFERVIHATNMRLKTMSQNRYTLYRKEEPGDARKRTGLELEVYDAFTGKNRSAITLSGGELFMTSLSLALGLSDVVQQTSGGVSLDAMFIDEGFGTLGPEVLELAVRTLSDMAGVNRIIGIISHVVELGERIEKQIRVEKTTKGSRISLVV